MDDLASNSRPLLQQSSSSSDEDDEGPNKMTPSTSTDSASTALTRRLTSTSDIDGDSIAVAATARLEAGLDADDSDDDNDDDADDPTVSVNHAKELLRSENAPHDRYGFTYVVFYLLGITTLLPWNFFITASDVSNKGRVFGGKWVDLSTCVYCVNDVCFGVLALSVSCDPFRAVKRLSKHQQK